jgi:uncharacterized membrane protein YtjA (UPF0391 family)
MKISKTGAIHKIARSLDVSCKVPLKFVHRQSKKGLHLEPDAAGDRSIAMAKSLRPCGFYKSELEGLNWIPHRQIPAHGLLYNNPFPASRPIKQAGRASGGSLARGACPSSWLGQKIRRKKHMLYWAVVCLIIAIVAGVLGFGGVAGTATDMARILFVVFLILFIVSLVMRRPV